MALGDPLAIGDLELANRVVLAPMAGIGKWFVRLQAKRFGAGLVISEMVSSFGIHYGNRRTLDEFLFIHPGEHPTSIQLFGADADVMAHAAEVAAQAGADMIDINMGCPVRKVCQAGAGAALLDDPDNAVRIARAARRASGLPTTAKLRLGQRAGERAGTALAQRLVDEAGVAAIIFHPRPADQRHKGTPDYDEAGKLVEALDAPVLVTGGITSAGKARRVFADTGCAAVLLARGAVGNPWLFGEALGTIGREPSRREVVDELLWLVECAAEVWGETRAVRHLRQIYPGFLRRLGSGKGGAAQLLMTADSFDQARAATDALLDESLPLAA